MFEKCLKSAKFLCFVGGAAAAVIGGEILKSKTARDICVKSLAKGMKIKHDAQAAMQNLKEDAQDIYYDAMQEADTDDIDVDIEE